MNILGNTSKLGIDNCLILTDNVGGLVYVLDWKGIFRGLVGIWCFCTKAQSMQLIWAPESMITVVSISFIVRGNDEFHVNVQGILLSRGTMNGNGEFLCQSSSPIQKSWLYFSFGVESHPMTRSSSSLANSLMETVVSTTATFLVGGQVEEWLGSRGGFAKVGQEAAIWPFCRHRRQHPSLKHFSLSSGVSFLGFSLVSTSTVLGSLEGALLVSIGAWNTTGVLDKCCFATEAAKCH